MRARSIVFVLSLSYAVAVAVFWIWNLYAPPADISIPRYVLANLVLWSALPVLGLVWGATGATHERLSAYGAALILALFGLAHAVGECLSSSLLRGLGPCTAEFGGALLGWFNSIATGLWVGFCLLLAVTIVLWIRRRGYMEVLHSPILWALGIAVMCGPLVYAAALYPAYVARVESLRTISAQAAEEAMRILQQPDEEVQTGDMPYDESAQ